MRSQTDAPAEDSKFPIKRHVPSGLDEPELFGPYCKELPAKVPPGKTVMPPSTEFKNA